MFTLHDQIATELLWEERLQYDRPFMEFLIKEYNKYQKEIDKDFDEVDINGKSDKEASVLIRNISNDFSFRKTIGTTRLLQSTGYYTTVVPDWGADRLMGFDTSYSSNYGDDYYMSSITYTEDEEFDFVKHPRVVFIRPDLSNVETVKENISFYFTYSRNRFSYNLIKIKEWHWLSLREYKRKKELRDISKREAVLSVSELRKFLL